MATGFSKKYFYTLDSSGLTQFSLSGEKIKSLSLDPKLYFTNFNSQSDGAIYLLVQEDGEHSVWSVDEESMEITSKRKFSLPDEDNFTYHLSTSIFSDKQLYCLVTATDQKGSYAFQASNQLVALDTDSNQLQWYPLDQVAPYHMEKIGKLLFIDHSSNFTNGFAFTIFDTESKTNRYFDVTDQVAGKIETDTSIIDFQNFTPISDNTLLFTLHNHLVYFDMTSGKVLDFLPLEKEEVALGIWKK